jgi:hypothetical protein
VQSQRGAEGGYWLAEPAAAITLADIIRAVDSPLANVRGARPESVEYAGSASHLAEVWIAVRVSLRGVLERITLADLVTRDAAGRGQGADRRRRRLGVALGRRPHPAAGPAPGRTGRPPLIGVHASWSRDRAATPA